MKIIVLLTLLSGSMLPVYSQSSIGVIAGGNLNYQANSIEMVSKEGFSSSPTVSWRAGLVSEHHLFKKFFLQPQLVLSNKGQKYTESHAQFGYTSDIKLKLLYAEAQANLLYKTKAGQGSFFVGIGPYIARGIGGMEKTVQHYAPDDMITIAHSADFYRPVKFRNEYPAYDPSSSPGNVAYSKGWDVGANVQVGYELKNGLFFNGFFERGFTNIDLSGYTAANNWNYGVSVGYFFKRFN